MAETPLAVLLVEDNPGDARLIRRMLADAGSARIPIPFVVTWHDQLGSALAWLADHQAAIILLDLTLPDSQGLVTVQRVVAAAPALPIVVLTGLDDEAIALQTLQEGAQDYLVKGSVDGNLLSRAIRYALERKQMTEALRQLNLTLEARVQERTAQLEAAVVELQRASRMKDEFMATVSHELRTPLTGVLGMAEVLELQFGGPLNERQLQYVKTIRSSGKRLLAMIESVLQYTSLVTGQARLHVEPCQVADLCAVALQAISAAAEQKRQQVVFAIEPPEIALVSDGKGITQVVQHLLENAVKFTPEGGQIGLAVRGNEASGTVRIEVWDTGIGIEPEQQARIFQPFTQADGSLTRRYEGMGLGLAIVRRTVDVLGGTIAMESRPGQGSRFTVILPLAPPASTAGRK